MTLFFCHDKGVGCSRSKRDHPHCLFRLTTLAPIAYPAIIVLVPLVLTAIPFGFTL